jgi:hypothetical protein
MGHAFLLFLFSSFGVRQKQEKKKRRKEEKIKYV